MNTTIFIVETYHESYQRWDAVFTSPSLMAAYREMLDLSGKKVRLIQVLEVRSPA